jgi:hypothetical protein
MKTSSLAFAFLGSVLVSCGGGQKGGTTTVEPTEEKVVGPPDVAWDDMKHEQRELWMKKVVAPKMKDMFAAFDAKRFPNVECTTCHGDSATDGTFKMPNPLLPKLPTTEEGFAALAQKDPAMPAMLEFMATKVTPEMAKLVGEHVFNPEEPEKGGFGCFECHTKAE